MDNKIIDEITEIGESLRDLYGENHHIVTAHEVQEQYLKILIHFEDLRDKGTKYEDSLRLTAEAFGISERTVKRSIKKAKKLGTTHRP